MSCSSIVPVHSARIEPLDASQHLFELRINTGAQHVADGEFDVVLPRTHVVDSALTHIKAGDVRRLHVAALAPATAQSTLLPGAPSFAVIDLELDNGNIIECLPRAYRKHFWGGVRKSIAFMASIGALAWWVDSVALGVVAGAGIHWAWNALELPQSQVWVPKGR